MSNCGGLLLPIGDPPLFLGYLRGVPFLWTINLLPQWLMVSGALLGIYFVWDAVAYRKGTPRDKVQPGQHGQLVGVKPRRAWLFVVPMLGCPNHNAATLATPEQPRRTDDCRG